MKMSTTVFDVSYLSAGMSIVNKIGHECQRFASFNLAFLPSTRTTTTYSMTTLSYDVWLVRSLWTTTTITTPIISCETNLHSWYVVVVIVTVTVVVATAPEW
jgi:hypothetical protein